MKTRSTDPNRKRRRYLEEPNSFLDYEDDPTLEEREGEDESFEEQRDAVGTARGKLDPKVNEQNMRRHTDVVKSFIIKKFNSAFGPKRQRNESCLAVWKSIDLWHADRDVALKAIHSGLDICYIKESPLKNDVDFWMQAIGESRYFAGKRKTDDINDTLEIWLAAGNLLQENPKFSLTALGRGLPVSWMPNGVMKCKDCLISGLRFNCITWDSLPDYCKGYVEFAVAASYQPDQDLKSFEKMFDALVIGDGGKLWMHWAKTWPERLPVGAKWHLCPKTVLSDYESMLAVLGKHADVARYIEGSLAANKPFVRSALNSNALCLPAFPRKTYDEVPEVVTQEIIDAYLSAGGNPSRIKDRIPTALWYGKLGDTDDSSPSVDFLSHSSQSFDFLSHLDFEFLESDDDSML